MLEQFFISVLNMSLMASYVIIIVAIVRLFLKKAPKIFSYVLWGLVLIRLLCPFSFESVIGVLPHNTQPISKEIMYQQVPQIDTGINRVDDAINGVLPPAIDPAASVNPLQIWLFIGSTIWLVGILVMLIHSGVQLIKLRRKLVGATPLQENIYLADHIASPFVMGVIKPKIYLPSSLSQSEQVFIIKHEQCHIKRFDPMMRSLGYMALCIHWFNPLVWGAFILSGKDMELSCDEAVMKCMDTDIRTAYATALLKFATGRNRIGATALAFGEGETKSRVKNVMRYKKPMIWVSILLVLVMSVMAIGLMSRGKQPSHSTDQVEELYYYRTPYVGDNSAVGNILSHMPLPDSVSYKDFEILSSEKQLIFNLISNGDKRQLPESDYAIFEKQAALLFSLIENLQSVRFNRDRSEKSLIYTREEIEKTYGKLYAKTETIEAFRTLMEELFYGQTYNNEEDQLEMSIHRAILERDDASRYDYICESHTVLKVEEEKHAQVVKQVRAYLLVLVTGFNIEGRTFTEEGGSYIPVALTFDVTADGEYVLNEYWEPRDGSYYGKDIKEKFPNDAHKLALSDQDFIYANMKHCYRQIIAYGNIDTEQMISALIDEIDALEDDPSNWRRQAKERDLTYFGDYLLDYASKKASEGNLTGEKEKILEKACDTIIKQGDYVKK